MSYKALYRTYRPRNFEEVKGQQHIVTTLRNIISGGKISHAYLFSGPRGTGKTSVAKVFAKILNCKDLQIGIKPCEKCDSCLAANQGSSLDIIEIDAASNNGIAEIRELRNNISFAPTNSKYKIYIIDEVHMLTKGAFNALLKTLEEPPQHAIFILATTEAHKIPITILSRTQRFNFRRVSDQDIISHLKEVFKKEQFKYDDDALKTIAALANGGLRDALSISDQAAAFTNGQITFAAISKVFGIVSISNQIELLNLAFANKAELLLKMQNNLIQEGVDLSRLVHSLIDIIKDFIIYKKTDNLKFMQVLSLSEFSKIKMNLDFSYNILDILVDLLTEISFSEFPRQSFELAILSFIKNAPNTKAKQIKVVAEEDLFKLKTVPQKPLDQEENVINPLKQGETAAEILITNPLTIDEASVKNLFQSNKASKPLKASDIKIEDIQNSTQIISTELDQDAINDDVQDSILSTQEINLNMNSNDEGEDELVDIAFEKNKETGDEEFIIEGLDEKKNDEKTIVPKKPDPDYSLDKSDYSLLKVTIPNVINLLVQTDRAMNTIVKEKWVKLLSYTADIKYSNFATLLEATSLIATGKNFIIVSSADERLCKMIGEYKTNNDFKTFINLIFGKPMWIIAVPTIVFTDVKTVFLRQQASKSLPIGELLPEINLRIKESKIEKAGKDIFGSIFN